MLDLENKAFCILGLPNSGKSTLACYLLNQFGSQAFIYDTLSEYPDQPFDSYVPKDRTSSAELEKVLRVAWHKYKLIVIDEANRFCPPKPSPLPWAVQDLNDWRAHMGVSIGYIARRPVQLNTDLIELCDYVFLFRLRGKNDCQYLNDLRAGLGDAVAELGLYHFIVLDSAREFKVFQPIPGKFKTDKTTHFEDKQDLTT